MPDRSDFAIHVPPDLRAFALRVLVVLVVVALALFAWRVRDVLLLVFGATLVSTLLRGLADPLARHTPLPQPVALAGVALALAAALAAALVFFGGELREQAGELAQRLPKAWDALQARLAGWDLGDLLVEQLRATTQDSGNVLVQAAGLAAGIGAVLTNLLLVLFGGVYLAAQPRMYRRGVLALLPDGARVRTARVMSATDQALRRWLVGQLVAMVVVGTLTAVGLRLLGVPTPLALGLLAGLLEFVPVIGPILAALPAVLVAFTVDPDTALWTAVLTAGIQQVENHALTPLISRRAVALPPALTLFAIVAAGVMFGPLGLLVAAPLTVVLYVAVAELWVRETLGHAVQLPVEPDGSAARDPPPATPPLGDPPPATPPVREPPPATPP